MSEAKHTPFTEETFAKMGRMIWDMLRATCEAQREIDNDGASLADTPVDDVVNGYIAAWSKKNARVEHLEAVNAKLLAACEAVEWVGLPFFVEHEWICAVCQRRKSEGHAPDCQLAAAIREGRG